MDLKLKRNVLWKAIESVVAISASFIQLAIIARSFEPTFVGQYQLVLAWLFLVSALSCFGGITMVSTRELSKCEQTARGSIFTNAIALQTIIGLPLCVSCLSIFFSSPYFVPLAVPLSIGTIALCGSMSLQLSQALLVSEERIAKAVIASIAGHATATLAIALASFYDLSVTALVCGWAAYNAINGLVLCWESKAWRLISLNQVRLSELGKLAVEVLPVLIMVLATHLYVRIDVIMLDHFTNEEVVAAYSAGYLFLDQLMILSNGMMSAIFPNFARSCSERGREYQVLYHGILTLFLKYLVPLALLIAIFSHSLLGTIFGAEYSTAWVSLSVLMLAALFAWLNGPSGTIFISLKKQHIYMYATLLSLTVNILGNMILIPYLGGIGAAVSTVLTEMAICTFCLWWIYRETGYLPWMKPQSEA